MARVIIEIKDDSFFEFNLAQIPQVGEQISILLQSGATQDCMVKSSVWYLDFHDNSDPDKNRFEYVWIVAEPVEKKTDIPNTQAEEKRRRHLRLMQQLRLAIISDENSN